MTSEVEKILREYSWVDDTELGEDKFVGHHDVGKATQALTTYIDSVVEQLIDDTDLGEDNIRVLRNRYKQIKGETKRD